MLSDIIAGFDLRHSTQLRMSRPTVMACPQPRDPKQAHATYQLARSKRHGRRKYSRTNAYLHPIDAQQPIAIPPKLEAPDLGYRQECDPREESSRLTYCR